MRHRHPRGRHFNLPPLRESSGVAAGAAERTAAPGFRARALPILALCLVAVLSQLALVAEAGARRKSSCVASCQQSMRQCMTNARVRIQAERGACQGSGDTKPCKREAKARFKSQRRACQRSRKERCRPCCKKHGTACAVACGNFVVDAPEACDDGNAVDGDGCENDCRTTVEACRTLVREGDLVGAASTCRKASLLDATDTTSRLVAAVLEPTIALLDDEQVGAVMRAYGTELSGSLADVCAVRVGRQIAGDAPRTAAILGLVDGHILPWADALVGGLGEFTDQTVVVFRSEDLPECLRRLGDVEVDAGDIRTLRAMAQGTGALMQLASAFQVNFDLADVFVRLRPITDVVAESPRLFTLDTAALARVQDARVRFRAALEEFAGAIGLILGETDDQTGDVLVIGLRERKSAPTVQRGVLLARAALDGVATFPKGEFDLLADQRLDLRGLFDGRIATLRPLLPAFVGVIPLSTFPDPTFAGIAPDMTQADIDDLL